MHGVKGLSRNTSPLFARASPNSERAIVPINECALSDGAPQPAIFCVHSVSGVAGSDFLHLARRLDPHVRFYGIQAPPGRLKDASFGKSIPELALYYADVLDEYEPSGPLILAGYCVGAVIALEMARVLRARGRELGPLVAIDGAPENSRNVIPPRSPRYWSQLAGNVPKWLRDGDLARSRSFKSLMSSISKNAMAIGRRLLGYRRGERSPGIFALDGQMDLSIFPPEQQRFINRLYAALFSYFPSPFPWKVIVYEAQTTPLLYLPQVGAVWRGLAPHTEILEVPGTHIGIMQEPYVGLMVDDLRARIVDYYAGRTLKPGSHD
jgi:thioesterase domain-containing protein